MSGFLIGLIVLVHVAVCIALMVSILLQSGKGGGLAGTFGAGSSQTLFGGRGAATFLSRATTILAVTFFLTSLTLGLRESRRAGGRRSLTQEEARKRAQRAPETTAPGNPAAPGGAMQQAPGTAAPGPAAPTSGAPQSPGPGSTNPAPAEPPPAPATGGGTQPPATGGP
jgi:preprotein translocase subunit SecG